MAQTKVIYVRCDDTLDARLRAAKDITGLSVAGIVKMAVNAYLDELEAKQARMKRIAGADPPEM